MRSRDGGDSDEFIREVDEAVRQDRWTAIWKQYNAYIVGAALAVVIGVSGNMAWQTYQKNRQDTLSQNFAAAAAFLGEGKPGEAASAFRALANDAGGGIGVIARLRAAEADKEAGNAEAKIEALSVLANDADADPLYQSLAELLVLQATFDDADADNLAAEIEKVATPDNPWRASLLELKALAEMKAGQTNEARATLQRLLESSTTPGSLQRRASELLEALGGPLEEDNQTVSQNESDEVTQE